MLNYQRVSWVGQSFCCCESWVGSPVDRIPLDGWGSESLLPSRKPCPTKNSVSSWSKQLKWPCSAREEWKWFSESKETTSPRLFFVFFFRVHGQPMFDLIQILFIFFAMRSEQLALGCGTRHQTIARCPKGKDNVQFTYYLLHYSYKL